MKLSVITIGRNAGLGLRDTANLVLMQSRLPDEYIIQDGGSSDGSVDALMNWLGERYRWEKAEMLKGEKEPQKTQKDAEEGGGAKIETADYRPQTADRRQEKVNRELGEFSELREKPQKDAEEGGGKEVGGRVCLWGRACEVRVRSEGDAGIYDALNRGIARAQGDVIGLLHAEDAYARSDVLALVMQAFEDGAEAVYGDLQYVRYVDGEMRLVRHWRSGRYAAGKLAWGWMPPHPTLFLRREVYERVALRNGVYFDPRFQCAGDYDLILRVLPQLRVPPIYIPRVLVHMRTGGVSNRNLGRILQKSREDWDAIRRNRIGSVHTLIAKNLRKVGQLRVAI